MNFSASQWSVSESAWLHASPSPFSSGNRAHSNAAFFIFHGGLRLKRASDTRHLPQLLLRCFTLLLASFLLRLYISPFFAGLSIEGESANVEAHLTFYAHERVDLQHFCVLLVEAWLSREQRVVVHPRQTLLHASLRHQSQHIGVPKM